jgi:hypothetical protein
MPPTTPPMTFLLELDRPPPLELPPLPVSAGFVTIAEKLAVDEMTLEAVSTLWIVAPAASVVISVWVTTTVDCSITGVEVVMSAVV